MATKNKPQSSIIQEEDEIEETISNDDQFDPREFGEDSDEILDEEEELNGDDLLDLLD